MSQKQIYYIAAFVGSIIGSYIPTIWGADFLSFSSLLFSTLGALVAIYLVSKLE